MAIILNYLAPGGGATTPSEGWGAE